MSGQDGGEIRPDVATALVGGPDRLLVSIRLAPDTPVAGPDRPAAETGGPEILVYSLGPSGDIVDRAGWLLEPEESDRLLAAALAGRGGGEIRVLVRSGAALSLARLPVPAADGVALWWPFGGAAADVVAAPQRQDGRAEMGLSGAEGGEDSGPRLPASPAELAEPRPGIGPGGEREANVWSAAGDVDDLLLDFEGAGRSAPAERLERELPTADGTARIRVRAPASLPLLETWILRRAGEILASGPVDGRSGTAASRSGSDGEGAGTTATTADGVPDATAVRRPDLTAARAAWEAALLAAAAGGALEPAADLEQALVESAGPDAVLELPAPWLDDLSVDGLLGLGILRVELARIHGERVGGYGAAVQALTGAARAAERLAALDRSADAAALATLVALESLDRGSRRRTRELLEAACAEEDTGPRRLALGVLDEKSGRRSAAVEHFERALVLDPTLAEARLRLAIQLVRLGREDRGGELLRALRPRRGAEEVPEWIAILALEEWSRMAVRKRPQSAIDWLEPAVAARPDHPTLRLLLAWALDEAGRREEADRHLEHLLTARPGGSRGSERARYNRWPREVLADSVRGLLERRPAALAALRRDRGQSP